MVVEEGRGIATVNAEPTVFPHSAEDLLRHPLQVLIVAHVDNGTVLLDGSRLIALLLQDGRQPKARAGKVGLEANGLLIDLDRSNPIAASVERGPLGGCKRGHGPGAGAEQRRTIALPRRSAPAFCRPAPD